MFPIASSVRVNRFQRTDPHPQTDSDSDVDTKITENDSSDYSDGNDERKLERQSGFITNYSYQSSLVSNPLFVEQCTQSLSEHNLENNSETHPATTNTANTSKTPGPTETSQTRQFREVLGVFLLAVVFLIVIWIKN